MERFAIRNYDYFMMRNMCYGTSQRYCDFMKIFAFIKAFYVEVFQGFF